MVDNSIANYRRPPMPRMTHDRYKQVPRTLYHINQREPSPPKPTGSWCTDTAHFYENENCARGTPLAYIVQDLA